MNIVPRPQGEIKLGSTLQIQFLEKYHFKICLRTRTTLKLLCKLT